jgi:hypothetical protein
MWILWAVNRKIFKDVFGGGSKLVERVGGAKMSTKVADRWFRRKEGALIGRKKLKRREAGD